MSSAMTTGIGAAAALGAAMATRVVAGLGAERLLMARSFRNDEPTEPYGTLRADPRWVTADDGTELYVEIDEPDDPGAQDVTIIFSHGYSLNLDTWHYQRRDLRGHARLVFWDQRSHGRSGRGHEGSHTIDQLGSDLGRVLDECAATGRVMLVGHSMGGMTIMGLAGLRPQLFGSRVLGAALLATSSGHLDEVRAAETQGMLAEPAADFIHGFIEAAHFVRPHGVVEQGVLNGEIGAHLHEHHPGCPVIYPPSGRG